MEMCGFDSEEEEEEDSSILATVKTSSKVMEEAVLEAEDKDVNVLSLHLLNQEEGLDGNGIQLKLNVNLIDGSSLAVVVVLNSIPKGTTQVAFLGILSKAMVLALCVSGIKLRTLIQMTDLGAISSQICVCLFGLHPLRYSKQFGCKITDSITGGRYSLHKAHGPVPIPGAARVMQKV